MVATARTLTYGAAVHFGRQVKKERLAKHWPLEELSRHTGIDNAHLSRIERGLRPPTEKVAAAMDKAFTHREGWFLEYYFDSLVGIPPGLRSWREHEDKATRLDVWCPGHVSGLFQTNSYAEAHLRTWPGATEEQVQARLAARTARRERTIAREKNPPMTTYVVDHVALLRLTGSPELMAEQMTHLLEVAELPHVTLVVMPVISHAATGSDLIIADHSAAYVEHLGGGAVYIEPDRVDGFDKLFTAIRGECYRASESAAIVRKARELWTGASRATARTGARTASRRPAATE